MTGKAVLEHSHPEHLVEEHKVNVSEGVTITTGERYYAPTEVATAVTFVVAVYQVNNRRQKVLGKNRLESEQTEPGRKRTFRAS